MADLPPPKRRLIYLAHARMPTEKAHGGQIARMCDAFAREGADVALIKPRRRQLDARWEGADLRSHYGLRSTFPVIDLPVPDLPLPFRGGGLSAIVWRGAETLGFLMGLSWRLLRMREGAGAALYTRDAETALLLGLFKKRLRCRIVFESHSRHRRLGEALARSPIDRWIALTTPLRDYWAALGVPADRIAVERDAVDPEPFSEILEAAQAKLALGIPPSCEVVGYVGRFDMMGRAKGLDVLIRGFARLASARPQLRLLLVGGPLEALSALDGLSPEVRSRVHASDFVPPSEVPARLAACDICVVPNPATDHYAHCVSPLKLFEYWAAGKPVVGTDLPSLRDVLEDGKNAVVVRPGDAEAMAGGILTLLNDQKLAARIAARGKERALSYTWTQRGRRILSFIFNDD